MIMGRAGHPRRLPDRSGLDEAAGRRRDRRGRQAATRSSSPRSRTRPASSRSPRRSAELVNKRRDRGHLARSDNESAKGKTRLVIELKKDAPGARHPQPPLQAHAAADQLLGEHGGAGRRRAPHAQPARRARSPTSTTRSRSSAAGPSSGWPRPQARAHIVEGLLKALDLIDADHRHHPGVRRPGAARDGAHGRAVRVHRDPGRRTSSTCTLGRLTRLGRERARERDGRAARDRSPSSRRSSARRRQAARRSSTTSWSRSATSSPTDRRLRASPTTPGDLDIEDLIDDEELVVTLSRTGATSRPCRSTRSAARAAAAAAWPAPSSRTRTTSPRSDHTTAHAYLLFFSNRGQVYRLKAHEIPMTGPHRARHGHRQPARSSTPTSRSRPSSTPATTRPTGSCSSPPSTGQVKKTKFTEYDKS